MNQDTSNENDMTARSLFEGIADRIVGGKTEANEKQYEAALVVLAATYAPIGADANRIARWIGIDRRTVAALGRRLEASKLWQGGGAFYDPTIEHEFYLAVLVAEGLIESVPSELEPAA